MSRRQSRSLGSVIIFMYRQVAASLAAMKSTSGAAMRSGWSMPVSVAMIAVVPGWAVAAYLSMPPVESMCTPSASTSPAATYSMTEVEHPHSGWMRKSAPGCSSRTRVMSEGRIPAWTWHSPSQTCIERPIDFSTYAPRNMSGPKRISVSSPCSRRMCSTTATALADVTQ